MTEQLMLDLPAVTPGDLSDLQFDGHEERLDQLDHARSRVDPFDAVDFSPPPAAPTCSCAPHGLHVTDADGTVTCWACGREVAPVRDLDPASRVARMTGGNTLVHRADSRDALRSDRRETA